MKVSKNSKYQTHKSFETLSKNPNNRGEPFGIFQHPFYNKTSEKLASVRVDWKKSHYNKRVSLHYAPTKKEEKLSAKNYSKNDISNNFEIYINKSFARNFETVERFLPCFVFQTEGQSKFLQYMYSRC